MERKATRDGPVPKITRIANAPIAICGRYTSEDGTTVVAVSWMQPDANWRTELVARADLMSQGGLTRLANKGFPAGGNQKLLVTYLADFEKRNFSAIPSGTITSQAGWQHGMMSYIWGTTRLTGEKRTPICGGFEKGTGADAEVIFNGGLGEYEMLTGFHSAGSADAWYAAIGAVALYPKIKLAIYAALAVPLLQLLDVRNFTIEWAARTSTGKTTALRLAASVWGRPDESAPQSAMRTWEATQVGIERMCGVISGLPLVLDDTSLASGIVEKILYLIASGRGRSRGTWSGLASNPAFRTIMLTTGEAPITSVTQKGGAHVRVLSLRGTPFGRADAETAALVERLKTVLLHDYGHAGPAFVQALLRERHAWPKIQAEYSARRDKLAVRVKGPEADRLLGYVAAIDIAAVLAHRFLPIPWALRHPGDELLGELIPHVEDAAGATRALRDIMSLAQASEERFYGRRPERGGGSALGRWDQDSPDQAWDHIAFYPPALKDMLKKRGYDPEAILADWRDRGWLQADPGNHTIQWRAKPSEKRRMVVILRHAIEEVEA